MLNISSTTLSQLCPPGDKLCSGYSRGDQREKVCGARSDLCSQALHPLAKIIKRISSAPKDPVSACQPFKWCRQMWFCFCDELFWSSCWLFESLSVLPAVDRWLPSRGGPGGLLGELQKICCKMLHNTVCFLIRNI